MTDVPDSTKRHREVRDSIREKGNWLREIRERGGTDQRLTPEELAEAKRAAFNPPADDERTAA
jgi:hypothetical protein